MRAFDVSFRRAALAYNRFDDSVRTIASYRQSGSFPSDWGNHVRDVMSFIRLAKVSLTKAINDAKIAAEDESLRDDELYELSDSEALLNSRLQRVIAVEESLLNTILSGDADYVSMYLASQQAHQDIEARIRRVAYGEDAPEVEPEPVEESEDDAEDDDTREEAVEEPVTEEETEDTEDVPEDTDDGQEPEDTDDGDGPRHVALVFGDDGTAHLADVHEAYVVEDSPNAGSFYEMDEDDEESTPDAEEVEDGWEPAPEDLEDDSEDDSENESEDGWEPAPEDIEEGSEDDAEDTEDASGSADDAPTPLSSMSFTDKARFIMEDADIQRLIHDEADRLARAQYQAMVFEAAAMAPKETRVAAAPESIPISEPEPARTETVPEPEPVVKEEPAPIIIQEEPPKKAKGRRSSSSAGTSSRGSGRKKEKAPKADKPAGRTFRLRRPKDEEGSE